MCKAIGEGNLSEALYYRLNVLPIHLPPLRERTEDIPLLAQAFLHEFSDSRKSFAPDALEMLSGLEWRGNVRELRNLSERISIFINSTEITAVHLRNLGTGSETSTLPGVESAFLTMLRTSNGKMDLLESMEKELMRLALHEANGNVTQASRLLGIDRNAFQRRVEKYSL